MILRRLASAIQQQDWFTILLEIMIVVLGVFIGLQVNKVRVCCAVRTVGVHSRC